MKQLIIIFSLFLSLHGLGQTFDKTLDSISVDNFGDSTIHLGLFKEPMLVIDTTKCLFMVSIIDSSSIFVIPGYVVYERYEGMIYMDWETPYQKKILFR